MVYEETQCADAWDGIDGDTKKQVEKYLKDKGIKLYKIEITEDRLGEIACSACTCPSGRTIRVSANSSDREVLIGLGFVG